MNNELYHYGVPGMKWGVRRAQNSIVASPRKPSKWAKVDGQGTTEPRIKLPKTYLKNKQNNPDSQDTAKISATRRKAKTAAKIALGVVGGTAIAAVAIKNRKAIEENVAMSILAARFGFEFFRSQIGS